MAKTFAEAIVILVFLVFRPKTSLRGDEGGETEPRREEVMSMKGDRWDVGAGEERAGPSGRAPLRGRAPGGGSQGLLVAVESAKNAQEPGPKTNRPPDRPSSSQQRRAMDAEYLGNGGGASYDDYGSSMDGTMGGSGGDETSLKRKRITQACDSCNKKKIKCDGQKPTCTNCQKASLSCSYSRGAKKRGPRAGYIESLENRLKEMEALLQPLQPELVIADMVSHNMEVWPMMDRDLPQVTARQPPPPGDEHTAASNSASPGVDGEVITSQGISFIRRHPSVSHPPSSSSSSSASISSQVPQKVAPGFNRIITTGPGSGTAKNASSSSLNSGEISTSTSTAHIPAEAMRELLDLFFVYIHPSMPFIHQPSFMANVSNESPLLLNSMYSLAARYSSHPSIAGSAGSSDTLYNNGDVFYIKARELVDHYMDVPNMSTVSALLCLATYAAGSGRGSAAWMYSGMAIRMAQELKLNIEPEFDESVLAGGKMSWVEKERRRRIWWTCFVLDRYAGAAADRSMIINEKDCKVYLPGKDATWIAVCPTADEPLEPIPSNDSFQISVLTSTSAFTPGIPLQTPFGYYVLLAKIFGKIIEYTNLYKPPGKQGTPSLGGFGGSTGSLTGNGPGATAGSSAAAAAAAAAQGAAAGVDKDYQLSILDASLRNWFNSLPDSMRIIGNVFTNDLTSESPPTYGVAYMHIFYHTCLIILHRPKMMSVLRDNPKSVQHHQSFHACRTSASEISSIISRVMAANPNLFYITAFVAFCVFQSGLIHVMAAQVSTDPAIMESSRRNADAHVIALAGVARYWFMAGRLHSVLKNLIESAAFARETDLLTMGLPGSSVEAASSSSESILTPPTMHGSTMPNMLSPSGISVASSSSPALNIVGSAQHHASTSSSSSYVSPTPPIDTFSQQHQQHKPEFQSHQQPLRRHPMQMPEAAPSSASMFGGASHFPLGGMSPLLNSAGSNSNNINGTVPDPRNTNSLPRAPSNVDYDELLSTAQAAAAGAFSGSAYQAAATMAASHGIQPQQFATFAAAFAASSGAGGAGAPVTGSVADAVRDIAASNPAVAEVVRGLMTGMQGEESELARALGANVGSFFMGI